jgi:hypothetical protein
MKDTNYIVALSELTNRGVNPDPPFRVMVLVDVMTSMTKTKSGLINLKNLQQKVRKEKQYLVS